MSADDNLTADGFSRALGTMFDIGQAGVDWVTVSRAVLAFREEERQCWLDLHDELTPTWRRDAELPQHFRFTLNAGDDASALQVLIQSALLRTTVRTGRDWQGFLKSESGALKRAVDRYQADLDPSPDLRDALIVELRVFLVKVGDWICDQSRNVQCDLEKILDEIFTCASPDPSARRRSAKA